MGTRENIPFLDCSSFSFNFFSFHAFASCRFVSFGLVEPIITAILFTSFI
jgi:hypothetical protein